MNREFPMTESEVLDEIRRQIESVGGSVRGVGLPLEEKMYESMVKLFKEHKRPVRRAEILKDIGHTGSQSASESLVSLCNQGRVFKVPGGRVAGWVPKVT